MVAWRVVICWFTSAIIPANVGAAEEVPPTPTMSTKPGVALQGPELKFASQIA